MLSTPFIALSLIATLHSASGFAPAPASRGSQSPSHSSTSFLHVGISFDEDNADIISGGSSTYPQLLQRANDCAKDEECSLEEWESVITEIEYISELDASDLERLKVGVHQLEERSALSSWISTANLPMAVLMFLASTYSTVTAPYDDIVIRIGWFFQDWNQVATQSSSSTSEHLPLFMCAAATYVALSEVASCFLPANNEKE
ncbi:unnamed protein product [Cylindrotheca closterium]|uniref:Uncharacterized protein n=1 Tax=Cylindrotheca closterium TaxID=2856 RepID=A0AAD2FJC3_9STRA|nr:unnamed protein product [Cylindrotheca closterium]